METSPPSSCGTAFASWRCSISARTKITCSQNLCPCSTLILRHVPRINTVLPWQWMSWKSPKHACTHQTPQCGWSCKYDNTVSSTRYEKFTWISTQANLHEIMSPVIVRMEVCALQFHREVLANAPVPRQSDEHSTSELMPCPNFTLNRLQGVLRDYSWREWLTLVFCGMWNKPTPAQVYSEVRPRQIRRWPMLWSKVSTSQHQQCMQPVLISATSLAWGSLKIKRATLAKGLRCCIKTHRAYLRIDKIVGICEGTELEGKSSSSHASQVWRPRDCVETHRY